MSEKHAIKIIALDFDGTIVTNKYPEVGEPIEKNIKRIKEEIAEGAKVILWTNRVDEYLDAAVNFCNDQGIRLEAVNENLPEVIEEFGGNPRKIFANEYWDDRAVWMSEYDRLSKTPTAELVMELQRRPANGFHHVLQMQDVGNFSDGYHTFNDLYAQRRSLSIALFNTYRHQSWKSRKHSDGQLCFGGGWFIVGIETPAGAYTYHYEDEYWNRFECKVLDMAPIWHGHTDKDHIRLETLSSYNFWIPITERLPEAPFYDWVLVRSMIMPEGWYGVPHIAELRNGTWYCQGYDCPMEETLGLKVTHWCPLPGDIINQEVIQLNKKRLEYKHSTNQKDIIGKASVKDSEDGNGVICVVKSEEVKKMKPQDVLRELRNVQEKHKDDFVPTFGIRVSDMARDSANTIETLVGHVKFLWGLLDDIDTAGDMAKSNDKTYRNIVEGIHPKRQLVAESDGYDISIKETLNGGTYHVEIPEEAPKNDILLALNILRTEFQKDQSNGSYYDSWVSNIACCIMDQYSDEEKDHLKANKAAAAFIKLLISKTE